MITKPIIMKIMIMVYVVMIIIMIISGGATITLQ